MKLPAMNVLKCYTLLLLMLTAFSLSVGKAYAADAVSELTGKTEEFLPVEQAYQVAVTVTANKIFLDWAIAPGYYIYRDKFKHYSITAQGKTPITPQLEPSQTKFDPNLKKNVEIYHNGTKVTLPITIADKTFELQVTSQGCADAGLCYAPHTRFYQIDLKKNTATPIEASKLAASTTSSTTPSTPSSAEQPEENHSLLGYLLLAIGGGMILNLMPCVFPVLSLKALTFASTSTDGHSHASHGWAYTFGVVLSFSIIAVAILALRAAGQGIGWGFQLQSPVFVSFVIYLFLVMGLSLSGMVHFGTSLMGVGQGLTAAEGLRGSFFTGVLAAVVASPCTGPLMAPAIGFALTQPWYVAMTIFIALGFGLALPFLALAYSPALARLLPRPGMWMETLKQFLAFPMYLTCAWLLWVVGNQVSVDAVLYLVFGGIAITFALWLFQHVPDGTFGKTLVKASAFAALVYAGYVGYKVDTFVNSEGNWQKWSPELVQSLRDQGTPIFVDFTADWCITCKANEANAINIDSVQTAFKDYGFVTLKGDYTNTDPAITEVLKQFKRSGVPLYVVYAPNKEPQLLPQILTEKVVLEAITKGGIPKNVASAQ